MEQIKSTTTSRFSLTAGLLLLMFGMSLWTVHVTSHLRPRRREIIQQFDSVIPVTVDEIIVSNPVRIHFYTHTYTN